MPDLSHQQQIDLTILVITLLEDWQVSNADKIILLALPASTRTRAMQRYLLGTPLPFNEKMLERIEHLIGIASSLRLANPRNSQAGALWMHRHLSRLQGRTPLDIMLDDGLSGIITVRKHLDCSYDWHSDGQTHQPD
jgi:hypothetical protein